MTLKHTLLLLMLTLVGFTACNKEEKNNAPASAFDTFYPTADDILVGSANFTTNDPLAQPGSAKVYKNSFFHLLRFEDFAINNGPNLRVYLSKSNENLDESINIDDLKAVKGSFNYTFSINTDIGAFRHIIVYSDDENSIYCVASL